MRRYMTPPATAGVETVSDTAPLKLPMLVRVKDEVRDDPARKEMEEGLAVMEKSGGTIGWIMVEGVWTRVEAGRAVCPMSVGSTALCGVAVASDNVTI